MKTSCAGAFLVLGVLTVLNHPAASRTKEFEEFVANVTAVCNKAAGISGDDRVDPPLTDDGKCCPFCACWVKGIGYMVDGKWNAANAKKINAQKWDDPKKAALNDEVDEICFKEVTTTGKKECESALQYRDCKHRVAKEKGLVKQ